ncbi:hypothetical protein A1O7_08336 [Cladophialophora yegresii CBS 114405]|uniref:Heterokaryon incompatibility domain-containing protein n=1 Tax=Cladophialophora yegresii CBS 114405 TaxID=1182544 RepID=W9WA27_9EURO|nr:uncharacterized protein A1O7_08336 [Cladophialophora yegresii CBS 114405]EXJ55409.1 hypothetical protein A1O7_08336 [Cladophialophora yegresii CBS 114405]
MRCQECIKLTPDDLKCDGEPVPFHDSFAAFEAFARSGCELCTVLFWNIQKFRWGRDERLIRHAELASSSDTLAVRWYDMGKGLTGHVIQGLEVLYRNTARKQRVTYSVLQDPAEVDLPVLDSVRRPPYTERIHAWMQVCNEEHEKCHAHSVQQATNPARPARLLDVQPEGLIGDVRLVPFDEAQGPYSALSYSWGDRPHAATTTSLNIRQRMDSISLNDLPRTFTDAIAFCREMNVRYLWVDALCIIQPRPGDVLGLQDWETQSAIMGYIYANAIFTIAAQGAASADIGLFPDKAPFDLNPRSCPLFLNTDGPSLYVKAEPPEWVASVGESALQQRAWVLQERLLSTRLIHFTQHGIFWECAERCASEFEPHSTEMGGLRTLSVMFPPEDGPENAAKTKTDIILEWNGILADYSERNLTVVTDKFPAVSAIAQRVAVLTGDTYLAGMWKSHLFDDLLWTGLWKFPSFRKRPSTYVAPTWSWASVIGKTSHNLVSTYERRMARVVSVSVDLANPTNPFGRVQPGASLQLAGRIRHNVFATLHDTAEDDAPWHDLWFEVPKGHALATMTGESVGAARHSGLAAVWFDVGGDHVTQAFSALLMTGNDRRDAWDSDTIMPDPEPQRISSTAMLIIPEGDDGGPYVRIGQANIKDLNFFVGCQEEVVELF